MNSVKLEPSEVRELIRLYWHYGKISGIRPEILFSQCMKETGYLTFERPDGTPGAVSPAHNNFAGIKTATATGDRPEDHETFATPEDGVRAHFSHMAAYVGLGPIGTPHARLRIVQMQPWAGSVRSVEELGGKWAPATDYGTSIVNDYLAGLLATEVPDDEPDWRARAVDAEAKLAQIKVIVGGETPPG